MQVRHNTALLEQAIALVVQRASIPIQQAEAEALAKRARGVAHRRLATGAGIALAAIGIGLGLFLGLWRPASLPSLNPATAVRVTEVPKRVPAVPPDIRPPVPLQAAPSDPVINYEKFATVQVELFGRNWNVVAGHHYVNENDKDWQYAWCYTNPSIDGVTLWVELAKRASPVAPHPFGPFADPATLAKAGLGNQDALELATKCPWLDGRPYQADAFVAPPGRVAETTSLPPLTAPPTAPIPLPQPTPPAAQTSVFQYSPNNDDYGNDILNPPAWPQHSILNIDQQRCEAECEANTSCVAFVFNKREHACFLKSAISQLTSNPDAVTGYKSNGGPGRTPPLPAPVPRNPSASDPLQLPGLY